MILIPTVILLGSAAWSSPQPKRACPVCHGGIHAGHTSHYCGYCESVEPSIQAQIDRMRRRQAAAERAERASLEFRARLTARNEVSLTEAERRRYWMGIGGRGVRDVTNVRRECRAWLTSIDQLPDPEFLATCDASSISASTPSL